MRIRKLRRQTLFWTWVLLACCAFTFQKNELVELTDFLHARSQAYFEGSHDILYTLGKGTEGRIEEVKQFKSGNVGLKIEILSGPHKASGQVWVLWNRNHPSLKLMDAKGAETRRPETAKRTTTTESVPAVMDRSSRNELVHAVTELNHVRAEIRAKTEAPCMTCAIQEKPVTAARALSGKSSSALLSEKEPDGSSYSWTVTDEQTLETLQDQTGLRLAGEKSRVNLLPGGSALAALSVTYGNSFNQMKNYRTEENAFKNGYFAALHEIENAVARKTGRSASSIEQEFKAQFGGGYVIVDDRGRPVKMFFHAELCGGSQAVSNVIYPMSDQACGGGHKIEAFSSFDFGFDPATGHIHFRQSSAPRLVSGS